MVKSLLELLRLKKDWLVITGLFLLATFILYGYFWFFHNLKLQLVYQNWDGPSYVIISKSFYDPVVTDKVNFIHFRPPSYFAVHLPLYPVFIRLFSFIGYFRSMLFVSQLFSLFSIILFYEYLKNFKIVRKPLLVALPLIFLTPRWFILYHVGASEPTFIFFLLLCFYFLKKRNYFASALSGSLATAARIQGLQFFAGILLYFLFEAFSQNEILKKKNFKGIFKKSLPFFLMPLTILGIFYYHKLQLGDFFAFYKGHQEFSHFKWPPFSIFDYSSVNLDITTMWLEGHVLTYLFYSVGLFSLLGKKLYEVFIPGLFYFISLLFLYHIDLSRLAVPLLPFTLIGFEKIFEKKAFWLGLLLVLPAFFRHAINFMCWNIGP